MKRTLLPLVALALALSSPAAAHAAPKPRASAAAIVTAAQAGPVVLSGRDRTAAIAAASRALDAISLLEGRFTQTSPDGSTLGGKFWLQRPGKLRFEYDAPSPQLIVADGRVVAVQDRALRTVDQAPLRSTPLYFILKSNINLSRDVTVTRAVRQDDNLWLTLRDRTGETDGVLTLAFAGPDYTLRRWRVTDGQGGITDVALEAVTRPARIDAAVFVAPAPVDIRPSRGGQ